MSSVKAVDLPVGSQVRSPSGDYIAVKRELTGPGAWSVNGLGPLYNYEVDQWIGLDAQILRVGEGSTQ